jgi:predicted flap endonuclease-1-like 5' DNA nuclease
MEATVADTEAGITMTPRVTKTTETTDTRVTETGAAAAADVVGMEAATAVDAAATEVVMEADMAATEAAAVATAADTAADTAATKGKCCGRIDMHQSTTKRDGNSSRRAKVNTDNLSLISGLGDWQGNELRRSLDEEKEKRMVDREHAWACCFNILMSL